MNKKLTLKNVIVKKVRGISIDTLNAEITKFMNHINVLNVKRFGPLVTKLIGSKLGEDGVIRLDYDLLHQAHNYKQFDGVYEINEVQSCEYCAYIHFEGKVEDLHFAHSKLDLVFLKIILSLMG
jgi:hypothetical protein